MLLLFDTADTKEKYGFPIVSYTIVQHDSDQQLSGNRVYTIAHAGMNKLNAGSVPLLVRFDNIPPILKLLPHAKRNKYQQMPSSAQLSFSCRFFMFFICNSSVKSCALRMPSPTFT